MVQSNHSAGSDGIGDAGYAFPLALQTLLPEDYEGESFRHRLDLLRQFGLSGLELNIVRPESVDPKDLLRFLAGYGLQMTMFATGATAHAEGLSLSAEDEGLRLRSVRRCIDFLDFAAQCGAGIIVGFLKGGTSPDPARTRQRFRGSLARIEPHARAERVPLLVEATHRGESAVANTLADTAQLILEFDNPYLRILPDTFHMNLEERDIVGALLQHQGLYDSVHISDSGRVLPGLGHIDLAGILGALCDAGFGGWLAVEGHVQDSFETDLAASMRVLGPVLSRLNCPT